MLHEHKTTLQKLHDNHILQLRRWESTVSTASVNKTGNRPLSQKPLGEIIALMSIVSAKNKRLFLEVGICPKETDEILSTFSVKIERFYET